MIKRIVTEDNRDFLIISNLETIISLAQTTLKQYKESKNLKLDWIKAIDILTDDLKRL